MYEFVISLSVIVFAVVIFFYLRHPACAFYHPATVCLGFHGLVFVFRPIVSVIYRFDAIYKAVGFYPTESERITVLLAANLNMLVFVSASLAVGKSAMTWRQGPLDFLDRKKLLPIFLFVAIPLGLFAIYANLWQWFFEASSGDINAMDLKTGARTLTATNGYFLLAGSTLGPIVVTFAFLNRFSPLSILPFVGFALLRLGTGGRVDFIVATAMMIVLYLYEKRRRWPNLRSVMLGLLAAFVFVFVVQDRGATVRQLFGVEGVNENRINSRKDLKPFEEIDYAQLEAAEYVIGVVPARTGTYDYFVANLQLLTEPIPRMWWKNKPAGAPIKFFNLYDFGKPIGMAVSMAAVGWMSLGFLGVAIWSGFFGWVYGRLYRWFAGGSQSNLSLVIYSIAYSLALIAFRDGTLIMIARLSLGYFASFVGLFAMLKVFRPALIAAPAFRLAAAEASEAARRMLTRAQRPSGPALPRARRALASGAVPRAWRT
jgi:hypothetical protein